jgi:hypothetical protein
MPGFVLAGQPVLHARPREGRYGFASQLAVDELHPVATEQPRNTRCHVPHPVGRQVWTCSEVAGQHVTKAFRLALFRVPAAIRHEYFLQSRSRVCKVVGWPIVKKGIGNLAMYSHKRQAAH